jgi:hypothetical protein
MKREIPMVATGKQANFEAQRFEIAAELRDEISAVASACRGLCPRLVLQAVRSDPTMAHSIAQAVDRGERLMVAFDVDSPDPLLRILTVSADQVATQHAAFGAVAPSERRN